MSKTNEPNHAENLSGLPSGHSQEQLKAAAEALEQIEQIQSEQGWNRDTMLDLANDFIAEKNLEIDFLHFLRKQQLEEKGNEGYEHLSDEQVESLRAVLKRIYMAGDGENKNSASAADAIYDGYNINEIMEELRANDVDFREQFIFDPETGEEWEADD